MLQNQTIAINNATFLYNIGLVNQRTPLRLSNIQNRIRTDRILSAKEDAKIEKL